MFRAMTHARTAVVTGANGYLALLPAGAPSGGFFADERQTAF